MFRNKMKTPKWIIYDNLILNSHFHKEHISNILGVSPLFLRCQSQLVLTRCKHLQVQCIFQAQLYSFIFLQICLVSHGQFAQQQKCFTHVLFSQEPWLQQSCLNNSPSTWPQNLSMCPWFSQVVVHILPALPWVHYWSPYWLKCLLLHEVLQLHLVYREWVYGNIDFAMLFARIRKILSSGKNHQLANVNLSLDLCSEISGLP